MTKVKILIATGGTGGHVFPAYSLANFLIKKVEVIVPDDQLSLAIGRRGQNVRLASHVSKWEISILTEGDESERRQKETKKETLQLCMQPEPFRVVKATWNQSGRKAYQKHCELPD